MLYLTLFGLTVIKAQSCASPITLTVNTGFTAKDSTNLSLTYYKFIATNTQHAVKFWIKGLSSPINKAHINTYSNNCGSLSTSRITSYERTNNDTLYIDMPTLSIGTQYLLELADLGSSYLVNRISIGNTLLTNLTTTALACPPSSVSCQSSTLCDLVCNGDFECLQTAVIGDSHIAYNGVWNWNCPSYGTADLFTSTTANTSYSVPCNFAGYQNPYSTNNYAGIIVNDPSSAEYIQTKLTAPMVAGKVYQVSFYISRSDYSSSGLSAIGAYLTSTMMTVYAGGVLPYTPSAISTNTALINDIGNWQNIIMTYTSSGGEQYLTIGRPTGATTVTASGPTFTCSTSGNFSPGECYLYIDKVSVMPVINLDISANPSAALCSGASATLSASSYYSPVTYTWIPGSATTSSISITPTASIVYTVNGNYNGCIGTNTIAITINTACCTSTNPAFVGTAFPTNTLGGLSYTAPLVFNNDVTIPSGMNITLANSEFLFAPGVKIIVSNGGGLLLRGAHLYGCGTTMWQGVVVQDGGLVSTSIGNPMHNLVEDAVTAIDVTGHTTSTLTSILNLNKVTFNKNFIGVHIDGYQRSYSPYPFSITECVFTSRNFTFNPTSWPTTSTSDLRSATTATTGLTSPYGLESATITPLKAPYSSISASLGISLNNVGVTSGFTFYNMLIGDETSASVFNLFDGLRYSIDAMNTNLQVKNNVFQNTQATSTTTCAFHHCSTAIDGGSAIRQNVNTLMNDKLDLRSTGTGSANPNFGNRFWNCHMGVEAYETYQFNVENAIFRSLQTTSGGTVFLPGNTGIYCLTDRFQYSIRNNEFTNINTCVNIPIASGNYDIGAGTQTGIYAAQLVVNSNTVGPQTATSTAQGSNYVNQVISINSPNSATWQFASSTGLFIQNNFIDRAYRGIAVSGLAGYSCTIDNNFVRLADDGMFSATQRAIDLSSTQNQAIVVTNTLVGTGITNTLATLAYFGSNAGTSSPSVTCNNLSSSYKAFEFNSTNSSAYWRGNLMQTHSQGLVLNNTGVIGTQGSSGNPSDNQWNGTWTGTVNCATYVDVASNATTSPLWVKASSPWTPPTDFGSVSSFFWYGVAGTLSTTTGSYVCTSGPPGNRMMLSQPDSSTNNNVAQAMNINSSNVPEENKYMANTSAYRYLDANATERNSSTGNLNYYNSFANTSIDKLLQVENKLYKGQLAQANSLNAAITATNVVEANYKAFYTIHYRYKNNTYSNADSLALANLANLCAGSNGNCVYQARSLYSAIYKRVFLFKEDCRQNNSNGSRLITASGLTEAWSVDLFPNPTTNVVNIVSKKEKENLQVVIHDISGKLIVHRQLSTSDFMGTLELKLQPGVYFITITNDANNKTTKKLVIAE